MLGLQLGHQLGDEPAGLLGVEVTHLLGHVHQGGQHLVVALLLPLLIGAASPTDLDGQLLTTGLPDQLASRLLLRVLGRAGGLVHGLTNLGTAPVADLLDRLVALPHRLVERLLCERDRTLLVEVLLANFLAGRLEGGDVRVVARFNIPVIVIFID